MHLVVVLALKVIISVIVKRGSLQMDRVALPALSFAMYAVKVQAAAIPLAKLVLFFLLPLCGLEL